MPAETVVGPEGKFNLVSVAQSVQGPAQDPRSSSVCVKARRGNLILVSGAQRSGTTLVQTLLANALENAPLLPESHILCDLVLAYKRAKHEWAKTSKFYRSEAELARFFQSAAEAHLDDVIACYGKVENLVLKDPNFAKVLSEIGELFPVTTRIVCIRDPRDIVASFLKIGLRQVELEMETRYTRRDIGFICKKITASYEPLSAAGILSDLILLHYEDLVGDPKGALYRVACETGLPLKLDGLEHAAWLDEKCRHQETWITELEGRGPTPQSVGSFRHYLTNKEIGKVENLCRELMDRFDYEPAYVPSPEVPSGPTTAL